MKRFGFLLMAVLLLVSAAVAFADNNPYDQHKNDDGIVTWSATDAGYINSNHDRKGYVTDVNGSSQDVDIKLKAEAYIPCYLKLELTGNEGKAILESFGPNAHASLPAKDDDVNFLILFDNEVGGYVDGNWTSLGHGRNAEIRPGPNVYIQSCDTFKVNVYSNDNFKYCVKGKSLENKDGVGLTAAQKWLKLQIGSSATLNGKYTTEDLGEGTYGEKEKDCAVYTGAACTDYTVFHKFRVPYDTNVAHGMYQGEVTFAASTI